MGITPTVAQALDVSTLLDWRIPPVHWSRGGSLLFSSLWPMVGVVALMLVLSACSDNGTPAAKPATARASVPFDADEPGAEDFAPKAQIQGPAASAQDLKVARAKKKCLEDKGWTPELDERSATVFGKMSREQADAYNKSAAECEADLKTAGVIQRAQQRSEAELSTLYDKIVAQTRCFEEHGFKTSQPPPSRRAFIDGGGKWVPDGLIRYIEGEELAKLDETCPSPHSR